MKLSQILCSAAAALAALASSVQAQQRTSHYLPAFPHVAPAHLHHGKHAPVYTYEPVYDAVPGPKVVDVVGRDGYPFPPVSGYTHRCGVMGGVSWYYLRPHITNNDAFVVTTGIGTASPRRDAPDFAWDFQTAYGAWAGWTFHNGIGIRGSFFRFDQDSETLSRTFPSTLAGTASIVPPGPLANVAGVNVAIPGALGALGLGTDQLTFDSGLELLTIDLEFTWDWRWNRFSMLLSAGGRYIDMEQSYRARFRNAIDIAAIVITEENQLSFINSFQGGGPTVGWFGRYQFAKCHLAVFGSFRAALLVGSSEREKSFLRNVVDPVGVIGNQSINPREVNNDDHTLPVLEAEVGLEWGFDLHHTRWFIRGSAVNQTYFDAGNAAGTVGDLSLFGGRVSVGVNY